MKSPAQQMLDWVNQFGAQHCLKVVASGDVSFIAPEAQYNSHTQTWFLCNVAIMTTATGGFMQPARLVVKFALQVQIESRNVNFVMDVLPDFFISELQQHVDAEAVQQAVKTSALS